MARQVRRWKERLRTTGDIDHRKRTGRPTDRVIPGVVSIAHLAKSEHPKASADEVAGSDDRASTVSTGHHTRPQVLQHVWQHDVLKDRA